MEKLDNKEISIEEAKAQASLAKQANNLFKYELERAKTMMDISEFNKNSSSKIELREIESKKFDNTI
ncbi:MAG: hypothetical protein LBQ68_02715 [Clostridiales bacterium]|nr:hypothetical protein [Clostridiales bacterium]